MHTDDARARFRSLHEHGTFLMPNPFDLGSARLLADLGFRALATTSGGFAASRGRADMTCGRDELLEHVRVLSSGDAFSGGLDAEDIRGRFA